MKTEPMKTAPAEAEKIELTEITPKQKGYGYRHALAAWENVGREGQDPPICHSYDERKHIDWS